MDSKKKFTVDRLSDIREVGSPLISPKGDHIIYNVTIVDDSLDRRKDSIVLLSLPDKAKETVGYGTPHGWSPSGSEFTYESEEGELCVYSLHDKSVRSLVQLNHSAHFIDHLVGKNSVWSPDGKYIAYLHSEPSSFPSGEEKVRIIDSLLYKSKGGMGRPAFSDNGLTHIYIIPAAGGRPEAVTEGDFNEHSLSWSPDSQQIAFISNRSANRDDNQLNDLFQVDIATKKVTRLTEEFGTAFQPAWSPDGKNIAYLGISNKISTNDSPADDTHICLSPAIGGPAEYLTRSLDRRVENLCWHPDSESIYFTAGDKGNTSIYRVSLDSREIETVLDDQCCISEYSLHPNGTDFAYVSSEAHRPAEIFLTENKGSSTRPLTHENDDWVRETALQEAASFWFDSFDGIPVQGWLMKPVDFHSNKTYPLVLIIHGGPHNMFGNEFDARMQLLARAGYSVVYMNPRGSHGYGQQFTNGNLMNWGGGDYRDLMLGLDHVLANNNWIDGERLGVTGQSYGGYMTNWIITQTDRFKAAVTDGGISNLISFSGTSLYHSLMESEFNGKAHKNYALLWQWSPLRNIANVSTPTLILHGETDNEVPVSQADELFVALKKCKVETQYVQYLGEGHGWRPDLSPANRRDLDRRMIEWFDRFIDS